VKFLPAALAAVAALSYLVVSGIWKVVEAEEDWEDDDEPELGDPFPTFDLTDEVSDDTMDQVRALVSHLPFEMHFIGGPFDGLYFHPSEGHVHDVNGSSFWAGGYFFITNNRDIVGYRSPDGSVAAVYQRQSDRNWSFLRNVSEDELA
jgi:hypothetical protein